MTETEQSKRSTETEPEIDGDRVRDHFEKRARDQQRQSERSTETEREIDGDRTRDQRRQSERSTEREREIDEERARDPGMGMGKLGNWVWLMVV